MPEASDDATLLEALHALYREVDALYADWTCPSSTECCRFGITGRQPYVTSIEVTALERALARRGGALQPKKRALPLTADAAHERICPLLDRRNRCSVYAARPLGCRTFFCERATPGLGPERDELRELVRRLQELAARQRMGGELARPITRVFE
jgi:Fe-S-cluster containining protein